MGDGRGSMTRVAYVTARFPPIRTSGTYRVEAMARNLPQLGLELDVLTLPAEWTGVSALEEYSDVRLFRPKSSSDVVIRTIRELKVLRWVQREALIPDPLVLWARSAARKAARVLEGTQVVYGTAPTYSMIVAAHDLARLLDVPYVQELRDPPSFDRTLRGRSKSFGRRMWRFEEKYLPAADRLITVTPTMRERFIELHPRLEPHRISVVTNGVSDIDVNPSLSGRDRDKFTVTYVGTFLGGVRQMGDSVFTPGILIPALNTLPEGRTALRIVGPVSDTQLKNLRSLPAKTELQFTGLVDRDLALAEIAAADIAVILADDDDWWIGRKVFEYLRYAHTILAIVPEGDTSRLLARHSRVDLIQPGDSARLTVALGSRFKQWSRGDWQSGPVPSGLQTDEGTAAEVAAILREVVSTSSISSKSREEI
ncbi:MAG: glycosyltransferase, partial [Acidimicrobiia bacterium]